MSNLHIIKLLRYLWPLAAIYLCNLILGERYIYFIFADIVCCVLLSPAYMSVLGCQECHRRFSRSTPTIISLTIGYVKEYISVRYT